MLSCLSQYHRQQKKKLFCSVLCSVAHCNDDLLWKIVLYMSIWYGAVASEGSKFAVAGQPISPPEDSPSPQNQSGSPQTLQPTDESAGLSWLNLAIAGGIFVVLFLCSTAYCFYKFYQFKKENDNTESVFESTCAFIEHQHPTEVREELESHSPNKTPRGSFKGWRDAAGFDVTPNPVSPMSPKQSRMPKPEKDKEPREKDRDRDSLRSNSILSDTFASKATIMDSTTLRSSFRSPPNSGSTAGGYTHRGGSGSSASADGRLPIDTEQQRSRGGTRIRNVTFHDGQETCQQFLSQRPQSEGMSPVASFPATKHLCPPSLLTANRLSSGYLRPPTSPTATGATPTNISPTNSLPRSGSILKTSGRFSDDGSGPK
ncbi:hypothetical protein DIPPA_53110 [Diplonema papillatum]|nr:hypothetical protein DIPPA_53110 [Diplonema papillatum]